MKDKTIQDFFKYINTIKKISCCHFNSFISPCEIFLSFFDEFKRTINSTIEKINALSYLAEEFNYLIQLELFSKPQTKTI